MIGFLIKKTFFDAWDNLIGLVVSNLGFLVCVMAGLGSFQVSASVLPLRILCLILSFGLLSFHIIGIATITDSYSKYQRAGLSGYKKGFKHYWRHGLFLWLMLLIIFCMAVIIIPFYLQMKSVVGLIFGVIAFWLLLSLIIAIPYYIPLMVRFSGDKPLKTLKKCYLVSVSNTGTTIFLLFYNILQIGLGLVTAGLLFSGTGMMLSAADTFKLLMYKIDYLEENPETNPKEIPWEDILFEEKENVGHRTLKGMIFPWKD